MSNREDLRPAAMRSTAIVLVRRMATEEAPRHPQWLTGYRHREDAYRRTIARRYDDRQGPWHLD